MKRREKGGGGNNKGNKETYKEMGSAYYTRSQADSERLERMPGQND